MMWFLLITIFLLAVGACVGSFLNVLIYRTIHEESWVMGRSHCDHCQKKIHWFDNIPLLSFVLLGGKSRCCKRPIPISYPIVELLTGILFAWWYWFGSLFFHLTQEPLETLQPMFWLIVGVLLLLIFFADLLYMIIPDVAVASLFVITLLYRIYLTAAGVMRWEDLLYGLMGLVLAVMLIGGIWFITRGNGMGFGDVKFVVAMALLLGWPKILVGLMLSFILGGLVGVILIIFRKKAVRDIVPFGPFLVIGTTLSLLWGDFLWIWYLNLL